MKKEGLLKITLSILVIILITLVSVWGVFLKKANVWKDQLPAYKFGMDLNNTNIISLQIEKQEEGESSDNNAEENTEENAEEKSEKNEENIYTVKNFGKSKNIIEKRLKLMGVDQCTIRLDRQTGNIVIELPTELSSTISQSVFTKGKFEIKIDDNEEVIADNSSIKNVETSINKTYANVKDAGSIVEMSFVFKKDAVNKFKNMLDTYDLTVTQKNTNSEGEELSGSESTVDRNVNIYLDGTSLYTTKLEEFLKYASTGKLPLTMGGYTNDAKQLDAAFQQANITKSLVLTENLPFEYTASTVANVHSNIKKKVIVIIFAAALAIMTVFLVIKKKLAGLFGGLSILGFITTVLLLARFTNVVLTIPSIFALGTMMILQFVYILNLLKDGTSSKLFNEKTFKFCKMLIPVFLMSITISFAKVIGLIGFGEIVFWGVIVFVVFNYIITRAMLINEKNK